ncbi:MAG: HutD family protein [Microvirga sp.]
MGTRVVRAASLARVPWKNGGGTTAEIAAHPEGAGLDAFAWRISLADVASDGPFSAFPGIDRTLMLVEGTRLALAVEGASHDLEAPGASWSFAGEENVAAQLQAGPIRDLNVMTRRAVFRHRMRLVRAGVIVPDEDARTLVLVALDGPFDAVVDGTIHSLGRLDALVAGIPPGMLPGILPLAGTGRAVLIEITPEDAP